MAGYRAALVWLLRLMAVLSVVGGALHIYDAQVNYERTKIYDRGPGSLTTVWDVLPQAIAMFGGTSLLCLTLAEILSSQRDASALSALYRAGLVWSLRLGAVVLASYFIYLESRVRHQIAPGEELRFDPVYLLVQVLAVCGLVVLPALSLAETLALQSPQYHRPRTALYRGALAWSLRGLAVVAPFLGVLAIYQERQDYERALREARGGAEVAAAMADYPGMVPQQVIVLSALCLLAFSLAEMLVLAGKARSGVPGPVGAFRACLVWALRLVAMVPLAVAAYSFLAWWQMSQLSGEGIGVSLASTIQVSVGCVGVTVVVVALAEALALLARGCHAGPEEGGQSGCALTPHS